MDDQLKSEITSWLFSYIESQFPGSKILVIFAPNLDLSRCSEPELSLLENYDTWDFRPDIACVFETSARVPKLAILNYAKGSLGLTELGEMKVYASLAQPALALQISRLGVSRDLFGLLLDKDISERLLSFRGAGATIVVGQFDDETLYLSSVFPKPNSLQAAGIIASNKRK